MIDLFRWTRTKTKRPLSERTGAALAMKFQAASEGAACLLGNLAVTQGALAVRIANGDLTEDEAAGALVTIHNAIDDLERACRGVSRARETVDPAAAHGGHEGGAR